MFARQLKTAVIAFVLLTIITGIIYPAFVTLIARTFFRQEAEGSLIYRGGKIIGSELIGQQFDDPKYLWGRPSATAPSAYNAGSSSGSNIGPSNPALSENAKASIEKLRSADPEKKTPVPVDLVTSSGSGIDPHISIAGAYYQIPRIARERGLPENIIKGIIDNNTKPRLFGVLGEPVVNVLKTNLDLDSYKK